MVDVLVRIWAIQATHTQGVTGVPGGSYHHLPHERNNDGYHHRGILTR